MSQLHVSQLKMLSVLQIIEKRTVPSLDNALLENVAGACQSIGAQILSALEGEQRAIFQDLCNYTTEQNITRVDPTIARSPSALIPITMLGTGALIGLILMRDYPHLVIIRCDQYWRTIRLWLRPVLSLVDCMRSHRRTIAIAHPARSSAIASLEQVSPTRDRTEKKSRDQSYQPIQLSPAHAPLPPDVLYNIEVSTTSEWKSGTGIELDRSPSITKRKALLENDVEDDVEDDSGNNVKYGVKDDEKSEEDLRPRKKRKTNFPSQTVT